MDADVDHARVMVAPPLVFLGYLVGALLLNWAVPIHAPGGAILEAAGGAAVATGLLLGGFAVSRMLQARTSLDPHQPTTALVTEGPYSLTRNPIYLGFFLIYLGFTLLAGTLWGLLLSPFLIGTVTRAIIRAEEVYLEGKFQGDYQQYKMRVRRWV